MAAARKPLHRRLGVGYSLCGRMAKKETLPDTGSKIG